MRKNVRKFQHFFPYNCKCPFSSHAKCEEKCKENVRKSKCKENCEENAE